MGYSFDKLPAKLVYYLNSHPDYYNLNIDSIKFISIRSNLNIAEVEWQEHEGDTDLCGITKTLTFHIARHTFASTVTLNNDIPIESVSKMLGHRSIKITQHYAKIIDKKVSNDMRILQERLIIKAINNPA